MDFKRIICIVLAAAVFVAVGTTAVFAKEKADGVIIEGDYAYIVADSSAVIVGYMGDGGALKLPSKLGGKPVTAIRRNVFINDDTITSVNIPASLTDISSEQFNLCGSLSGVTVSEGNAEYSSVGGVLFSDGGKTLRLYPAGRSAEYDIPAGVVKIAPYAFFTNKELTRLSIPETVTEIGEYAFYNCSSIREVVIPDSVTTVGAAAFSWCLNLKELYVPPMLTDIGRSAFYPAYLTTHSDSDFVMLGNGVLVFYGGNDEEVTLPDGVRVVTDAFFGNDTVKKVVLPDSVEVIGDKAFYGCVELKSVNIPSGVTKIGDWAFFDCEKITSVTVPDGASVGEHAFSGCLKLKSVRLGSVKLSASAFERCPSLERVEAGEKLTTVGKYAFYFCEDLTSVTLPAGLESIGDSAFRRTGLTSLTLGSGVKKIGKHAFLDSDKLTLTVDKGSYAYDYAVKNKLKKTLSGSLPTSSDGGISDGEENGKLVVIIGGGAAVLCVVAAALLIILLRRRCAAHAAAKAPEETDKGSIE